MIHLHEIEAELRKVWDKMTANDDALAALQAEVAQLSTDVTALIAAVQAAPGGTSDDVSAGIEAVTTTLSSIDASVVAATPAAPVSTAPAAGTATAPSVADTPPGNPAAVPDPKDAELAALRAQTGSTPA